MLDVITPALTLRNPHYIHGITPDTDLRPEGMDDDPSYWSSNSLKRCNRSLALFCLVQTPVNTVALIRDFKSATTGPCSVAVQAK
jgi:hypothetical protein